MTDHMRDNQGLPEPKGKIKENAVLLGWRSWYLGGKRLYSPIKGRP